MTARSSVGEQLLLAAFVAVALAFFAANAYTQHAMRSVDVASDDIALNSAPSIRRLAAVRTAVREAQFLVGMAVTLGGKGAQESEAAVGRVNAEARAYLALPTFPGERAYWRELNEAISAFDASVQLALAQRGSGELASSRETLDVVASAADRVSVASATALEFNAENGRELALRIKAARQKGEWVGYGVSTSLALLTLLAGVLVHRQVRGQRALVEARAEMQNQRAIELETFAGRAAHDILNPVSATQLALSLVSKKGVADVRGRELVARAQRNLLRIRAIIDLLQFARAGARPSPGVTADVPAVLEDVADGIQLKIEAGGIELHVEPPPPCRVACSVGVLTSVLSNLAHNAIKYMGDGPRRSVTLRASSDGALVHLEVEDSGPGIPPELVDEIFTPYVRGPTHGVDGVGLGLATVKRLAETHGGRVGVRTVVGRGSVFWVDLPGQLRPPGSPGNPTESNA